MSRLLLALSLGLLVLLLTACTPLNNKQYTYVPPTERTDKLCTAQCLQGKNSCEQICDLKNEKCLLRTYQTASQQYQDYISQMQQMGRKPSRRFKEFQRKAGCYRPCHCVISYNTCYRACGGQVFER